MNPSARHDTFEPHLAGMGENGRAVALDIVEPDARSSLGHDRCERGLADLKRITPQVVAVQLDEIKGVKEYALVSALVTDEIERSNAVVIAGDSFGVDNAGGVPTSRRSARSGGDLRAMTRKPTCLISCTHWLPDGSLSVLVGSHGAMNPAGRVRCNMRNQIRLANHNCK